jgi:hypothetical protein
MNLPSLVGYDPDEAEVIAAQHGLTIAWLDATPPPWLPPEREPRIARQRLREDGTLELLRVLSPIISEANGNWRDRKREKRGTGTDGNPDSAD